MTHSGFSLPVGTVTFTLAVAALLFFAADGTADTKMGIERESSPEKLVVKGKELQDKKAYREAIMAYDKALALKAPRPANVATRIGRCYEALGDLSKAAEWYEKAISLEPLSYDASQATYFAMAAAVKRGDAEKAKSYADRMKKYYPDSSYVARTALLEAQLEGRSTETLSRALDRELEASSVYDQALESSKNGQTSEAIAMLERVEKGYPETAAALRARASRGHLLIKERRTTEALELFEAIVAQWKDKAPESRFYLEAKMRAAALAQILDKREQALKDFMDVLGMGEAVPASYKENALLQAVGVQFEVMIRKVRKGEQLPLGAWEQLREMCREAENACSKRTDKARARLMFMESFMYHSDYARTAQEGLKFLTDFQDEETSGEQIIARYFTAVGYQYSGDVDKAIEMYKLVGDTAQGYEVFPALNHVQHSYLRAALLMALRGDSPEDVEKLLEKLDTHFPSSPYRGILLSYLETAKSKHRSSQGLR